MTPDQCLRDLLWRLGAEDDASAILSAADLGRWPSDFSIELTRLELLAEGPIANRVTCPACEDDHVEAVEFFAEGTRLAILCPNFGRVPIDPNLVQTVRIVPGKLARFIRAKATLGGPVREIAPGRVWSLGRWLPGSPIEVFLVRGLHWPDGERLPRLLGSGEHLVIVTDAGELPNRAVALADLLSFDGTTLTIDRARLVAGLAETGVTAHASPLDGSYALVRDKTGWNLAFGRDAFHLDSLEGLSDIHTLLSRPHETLLAWDLVGGQLVESGLEMVDDETIRTLRAKLAGGGPGAKSSKIHQYLRETTGLKGTSRTGPNPFTKAGNVVRNRVNTALTKIREVDADMASHLKASLKTGIDVRYLPKADLDWRL